MKKIAWGCAAVLVLVASAPARGAEIIKTLDRKFPVGKFCPFESRAAQGADLSFVAPAATVRITFSGNNFSTAGLWNQFRVDDVTVVDKAAFDLHLISPVTGYADCYEATNNAPGFDFLASGTNEKLQDFFATDTNGWTGAHLSFNGTRSAPNILVGGPDETGGALALGQSADGAVPVWASKTVTGLTPGVQYVVFGWWYAFERSPLTIRVGVPCVDQDGDSFVLCTGSCDLGLGQTCGDCNDTNPGCASSCTDLDGDGLCVGRDCDDNAAGCTSDCATDLDTDAIPDCRDSCLDVDRDGYGVAGGGGNTCAAPDCNDANRYCTTSCTDADGDGRCAAGDCDDSDPGLARDLIEVNDCFDQQCPGSPGAGVADEISGNSGFLTAGNKNVYSWPAQSGAFSYLAVRSTSPTFSSACTTQTTSATSWTNSANPVLGTVFYYLIEPESPCTGSWGQRSNGVERSVICGTEGACANGLDDDGDGFADCVDDNCSLTAACTIRMFNFLDGLGDNIADNALATFFASFTAHNAQYFSFEVAEPRGVLSWCADHALFYQSQYLSRAATSGTVSSGAFNKWHKAPATGNAWVGPETASHVNTYGDDAFGPYSWCSEQFAPEPKSCIFPNRTNDCEIYDLATGACHASIGGGTWQLTIRVAATRLRACGF